MAGRSNVFTKAQVVISSSTADRRTWKRDTGVT